MSVYRWILRSTGWHRYEMVSVDNANRRMMGRVCDGTRTVVRGGEWDNDVSVSQARPTNGEYAVCAKCVKASDTWDRTSFAFSLSEMFCVPFHVIDEGLSAVAEPLSVDSRKVTEENKAFMREAGLIDGDEPREPLDDFLWARPTGVPMWHVWAYDADTDPDTMVRACDYHTTSPVTAGVESAPWDRALWEYRTGRVNCGACAALWPWMKSFDAAYEKVENLLEASQEATLKAQMKAHRAGRMSAKWVRERNEALARVDALLYDRKRQAATNKRLVDENVSLAGKLKAAQTESLRLWGLLTDVYVTLGNAGIDNPFADAAEAAAPVLRKSFDSPAPRFGRVDKPTPGVYLPVCLHESCAKRDDGRLMNRGTRAHAVDALAGHWANIHHRGVPLAHGARGMLTVACPETGCTWAHADTFRTVVVTELVRHVLRDHQGEA